MARRGGLLLLLAAVLLLAVPCQAGTNSTKSKVVDFAPEADVDNNDDVPLEGELRAWTAACRVMLSAVRMLCVVHDALALCHVVLPEVEMVL